MIRGVSWGLVVAVTSAGCSLAGPRAEPPPPPPPPEAVAGASLGEGGSDAREVPTEAARRADGPPAAEERAGFDPYRVPEPVPVQEYKSPSGNPESYEVRGRRYRVRDTSEGYSQSGGASWYGARFHGRTTSSGEPYDMYALTAAHRTLPLPTYALVENLDNGRSVVVRINDRGPFHPERIIDVSYAAALRLGLVGPGTARVRVTALDPPALDPPG